MTAIAHAPGLGARALQTAARGAVLVGVAVVIGIVLLKVVGDSGGSGASGGAGHFGGATPTTIGTQTTTTVKGQAPQHTTVAVYNASGIPMAATTRANSLRGLGYAITFTGNAATPQTGTTVACRSTSKAFTATADTLAKSIGPTTDVQVFPAAPPSTAASAACIVTIGK
jgi:hypothetical protein